ncbi:hypothetical protein JOF53_002158 [Crossiella equi]|uniref:Lipoprotein n=1 Tax=Crossiella equi TaxID=130796 RepID=A0ABS5AAE5_9PSEU|nr:DUF3558 family protein [Crossiella equi]MBP2473286.1 hypothetical protein [Crossiella equi]
MRSVLGLIAVGLLALSGCTGPSSPPPPATKTPTGQARSGAAEIDKTMAKRLAENVVYRSWDTCALHDPEAAKKIFGEPETLAPDEFDQCQLRLKNPDLTNWLLTVGVGVSFVGGEGRQKTEIAGAPLYSESREATYCTWSLQTAEYTAISLRAMYSGTREAKQPPRPVCEMVKDYLTTLVPIWRNPPLRTDNATDPALSLALKDPCATYEDLAKLLGEGADKPSVFVNGVYTCTIRHTLKSKTGSGNGIEVKFSWGDDPVAAATRTPNQYRPVQVEGHAGSVEERKTGCKYVIKAADTTITGLDDESQRVEVEAPTCPVAEQATKLVVKAALG